LSHKLVEFIFTIPSEYKISHGWTKYILRKSFDDILPKEIAWRKDKIGYEPPQSDWMKNRFMKDKIVDTIEKLDANGVLNKQMVRNYKNNFNLSNEIEWRLLSSSCLF
jgi:asparagine synthase (glutamine-hydrolysing)